MMIAIAMLPIMGSLAIAVDFSEMNRQKQATVNALDAAGIATARQVVTGASDEALIAYANEFFKANLGPVDPDDTDAHRRAAQQPVRRRHAEALRGAQLQAVLPPGLFEPARPVG